MTTNAKIGHGTLFALHDGGSPGSFATVAEVTSVTPPSLARDAVEATHMESPEGWREFIPGLKDAGEVTFEMNFIPGGDAADDVLATFNSDEPVQCKISFPDSPPTEWTFTAICTAFEVEAPVDDKMTATVTFKLTGKPAFIT